MNLDDAPLANIDCFFFLTLDLCLYLTMISCKKTIKVVEVGKEKGKNNIKTTLTLTLNQIQGQSKAYLGLGV